MKTEKNTSYLLYGVHPCRYALLNPHRSVLRVYLSNAKNLEKITGPSTPLYEIVDKKWFDQNLPRDAVHQGVAASVRPLAPVFLDDIIENKKKTQRIIVLDQVSDPHNIGAILRTCAVFDATALVLTDRHAPQESAILAKAACGALEKTPIIRVSNLASALDSLKDQGFWCYGLAESGKETLENCTFPEKTAFIMGAEGDGMRRLTMESCDVLLRLKTSTDFSTLNVSNATAIALHSVFLSHHPS